MSASITAPITFLADKIINFFYSVLNGHDVMGIILTLVITSLSLQLFLALLKIFTNIIQIGIEINNLGNTLSVILKRTMAVITVFLTLTIITGVYVIIKNPGSYLPLSEEEINFISKSPLVLSENNILYLLFPVIIFVTEIGASLLRREIKSIQHPEKKKGFGDIISGLYSGILLGVWSFSLPVGLSIYWSSRSIFSFIVFVLQNNITKEMQQRLFDYAMNHEDKYPVFVKKMKENLTVKNNEIVDADYKEINSQEEKEKKENKKEHEDSIITPQKTGKLIKKIIDNTM